MTLWDKRAQDYNKLEWANHFGYLQYIVELSELEPWHDVLDVGTGTGKVAHAIAPLVRCVVGIDTSAAMLRRAQEKVAQNETFLRLSVCQTLFYDDSFDRVTARMVFHHLHQPLKAMAECHRVLKPGGLMLVAEGIPPHPALYQWWKEMFALKEDRVTFLLPDLVALFENTGFVDIKCRTYVSSRMSIKDWLQSSGLERPVQDTIYQMHLDLSDEQRRHYNAVEMNDDMFLDFKNAVVTGRKHA